MKQAIHPTWYDQCQVTCSCGNQFTIGSVSESLHVDICNKCHPFFTGEMKFVDRQGRVDRFMKKVQMAASQPKSTKLGKKAKQGEENKEEAKSYKDILRDQQSTLRKSAKKAE